jgi:hypothetical protein
MSSHMSACVGVNANQHPTEPQLLLWQTFHCQCLHQKRIQVLGKGGLCFPTLLGLHQHFGKRARLARAGMQHARTAFQHENLLVFLNNLGELNIVHMRDCIILIPEIVCFQPRPGRNCFPLDQYESCVDVNGPQSTTRINPFSPLSVSMVRFPTLSLDRFLKNVCHRCGIRMISRHFGSFCTKLSGKADGVLTNSYPLGVII